MTPNVKGTGLQSFTCHLGWCDPGQVRQPWGLYAAGNARGLLED